MMCDNGLILTKEVKSLKRTDKCEDFVSAESPNAVPVLNLWFEAYFHP